MNFREFINSTKRIIHITTKPSRKELLQLVKLCLLGILIIGGIGFVVKVLFWIIGLAPG